FFQAEDGIRDATVTGVQTCALPISLRIAVIRLPLTTMLIDGTGGPPRGPVDIVVNGNRITAIRNAGTPGLPLRPNRAPKADYERSEERRVGTDARAQRTLGARRYNQ